MRFLLLALVAAGFVFVGSSCKSSDEEATPGGGDGGTNTTPGKDGGKPGTGGGGDGGGVTEDGAPAVPEKVTVTNETINVDGTDRSFVLVVPKTYDANKKYPLVLTFHGDGQDGASLRAFFTFDNATGDDAILVYPTGINQGWDIYSVDNRDIRFAEVLRTGIAGRFNIDDNRVFGFGFSAGAFFVNKLACRKTGFFRAITSHAGGAPDETDVPGASRWPQGQPGAGFTKCPGQTGGVPVLSVGGTADGDIEGIKFTAMYWAAVNGCNGETTAGDYPQCVKYTGCPDTHPVTSCTIEGMVHYAMWDRAGEASWAFLKSFQ